MDNIKPRFTEEDMKKLYKAEIHFTSVLKQSTLKGAQPSLTKEIAKIYENTFGKKLNRNYNCNVCSFSIYRIVGEAYFAQLEEDAKNKVEEEEAKSKIVDIQEAPNEDVVEESQKKTKKTKKNIKAEE